MSPSLSTTVLTLALAATSAFAHFTLDYPGSRGFVDDTESQFCGGFPNAGTRQPFPLAGGPFRIDQHHPTAVCGIQISLDANPAGFDNFNKTSNGTDLPFAMEFMKVDSGELCWNVDLSDLNLGLTNGSQVTLQVVCGGDDGNLYQCTDLTLLSDFTVPSNETCSSGTSPSASASGGHGSSSSSSASATSSAPAGASSAPASPSGAAGALVANGGLLGVVAAALGVFLL